MSLGIRDILIGLMLLFAAVASLEAIAVGKPISDPNRLQMEVCASCVNGERGLGADPNLVMVHAQFDELTMAIQQASFNQDPLLRGPAQDKIESGRSTDPAMDPSSKKSSHR